MESSREKPISAFDAPLPLFLNGEAKIDARNEKKLQRSYIRFFYKAPKNLPDNSSNTGGNSELRDWFFLMNL